MRGHIRKRTNKSGTSWQVVFDKGIDPTTGKRIRSSVTVNGTKKDAEKIMTETVAKFNNGTYIEPTKKTLNILSKEWLEVYAIPTLAPNTLRGYKVNLDNHALPVLGETLLQKITPQQLQGLYASMSNSGLSPRTVQYVHSTLRVILNYAYKMRYIEVNPVNFVTSPKQVKKKLDIYDEQEAQALLKASTGSQMEMPVHLAVLLGLRRGEVLALRWQDVDYSEGTVHIQQNLTNDGSQLRIDTPKTHAGIRKISYPQSLAPILKAHFRKQGEERLFLGHGYQNNDLICCKHDGTPINPSSFSHSFSDFLKEKGLRHIRFHDLRHTNATLMLQLGIPAKVASERLGHANIKLTLDTYTHVLPQAQKDAADKLDSLLNENHKQTS